MFNVEIDIADMLDEATLQPREGLTPRQQMLVGL